MAIENRKQLLLIVFAVAAGIIATVLTSKYVSESIQKQTAELKEEYDRQQKEMVARMQQDSDQRMAALSQQIEQSKAEQAQNLQQQIAQLQTQLQTQTSAKQDTTKVKRAKPSLALKTPASKRAVTVMIDSLAAVGGLLNPGDVVDVIAHLTVPDGSDDKTEKKNTVTAMVFQNLEVLAVNTNLDETGLYYDEQQAAGALKVTVAVDPQEAGLLAFADKNGKLELALRSPDEKEKQIVKTSTWKTLADYVLQNQGADIKLPDELKEGDANKTEEHKDTKTTIQIFRGGKEL